MKERRKAAVVLAVCAAPPHGVVFVERAAHLRDHPGQIGLPGGGADEEDAGDLAATALRELHEEVGVARGAVRLVGRLPEVRQRVGRFDVTPFVGVLAAGTELRIDPAETAAVFTIPLARIVAPGALREGHIPVDGLHVPSYILEHGERLVWGLTGRILREFLDAWNSPHQDLRHNLTAALEAPRL